MELCSIGLAREVTQAPLFRTMRLEGEVIRLEGFELGVIYSNPDNHMESACPVCGYLLRSDNPPVANVENGVAFSWDICPCCNVQFGLDDEFTTETGGLEKAWKTLREAWLNRVDQTTEIIEQLRNIRVDLNVNGSTHT